MGIILWQQIISRECDVLYVSSKKDGLKVAISDRHMEKNADNSITYQFTVPVELLPFLNWFIESNNL